MGSNDKIMRSIELQAWQYLEKGNHKEFASSAYYWRMLRDLAELDVEDPFACLIDFARQRIEDLLERKD